MVTDSTVSESPTHRVNPRLAHAIRNYALAMVVVGLLMRVYWGATVLGPPSIFPFWQASGYTPNRSLFWAVLPSICWVGLRILFEFPGARGWQAGFGLRDQDKKLPAAYFAEFHLTYSGRSLNAH